MKRGQKAIDAERAREIQEALIREHYLDGEPSGEWDGATQSAMQRYQEDQGWQSKTTPDSRALIKLGLGPSHEHLLNPESAMTMPAAPISADPKTAKQAPSEDSVPKQ
ncbi:MAG: peptidoglycan-binding domain-containing protein [Terriglobales bacterium]|jgi:peptidoglycan hydrolase-like protein with peptidoglycan-binding domain